MSKAQQSNVSFTPISVTAATKDKPTTDFSSVTKSIFEAQPKDQLEMVDEAIELPPDPKVKEFGRKKKVKVRLDYITEPTELLGDLTEFIYKNAPLIDYDEGPGNLWLTLLSAVLSSQSSEHLIFKQNLDKLIEENIKETGVDPRIEGPPKHIAEQTANVLGEIETSEMPVLK